MSMMQRRSILKLPMAALAGGLAAQIKLPSLGRVKPQRSVDISASPFSIGSRDLRSRTTTL